MLFNCILFLCLNLIVIGIKLPHSPQFMCSFPIAELTRLRGGMNLYVKTLSGKSIAIEVEQDETIEDIKNKIKQKEGISVEQQRIVFGGRQLDNQKSLLDYDINEDATLHLVGSFLN